MKEWELHQKHDRDINEILKADGCLNDKGNIVKWSGPETWPKIIAAGHTSVGFENCECKRKADDV